jgi:hypothetical protein
MELDFNNKNAAPSATDIAALMQARRSAEAQQRQEKDSRIGRILEAVKTGQQIAGNMMELARQRSQTQGIKDLSRITLEPTKDAVIANRTTSVPAEGPATEAGETPLAKLTKAITYGETQMGQTQDQRKNEALLRANPDAYTTQAIKGQFPGASDSNRRYQQSALEFTDDTGRTITVATTFDTQSGQQLNPMTNQPITSNEDLKGLVARGYAQSMRPAGYDSEGREVVASARDGSKYIVELGEDGQKSYTAYNDRIFQRLENPPATFTVAIAELGSAGELLKTITESFDPAFAGPVAARAGKLSRFVEALTDQQRVEFYGNVAEYKNSIIKAITGAQMSEIEARRIVQQIPDENASPTAFLAGVKRAYDMTNRRLSQMERAIQRSGGVVRGENETAISEEDLTALIDKKLGKMASQGATTRKAVDGLKEKSLEALKARRDELLKKKGN